MISVVDVTRGVERTTFQLPAGTTAPHGAKLRPPHSRELFTNAEAGHAGVAHDNGCSFGPSPCRRSRSAFHLHDPTQHDKNAAALTRLLVVKMVVLCNRD
jgi:hypothetical protein